MTKQQLKDVPQKKKRETLIMFSIALVIIIAVCVVVANSKPAWQREEDDKLLSLNEVQKYDYTQALFASTLIEENPTEITEEGWSWETLYRYVSSQTHYACYQLPNTTASKDTVINDFVRCEKR